MDSFLSGQPREDIIQAIALLNRAMNIPDDEHGWDAKHGYNDNVSPLGRVMRQQILELFWCVRNAHQLDHCAPGAFYMPCRSFAVLDRIGLDPEVLR